MNKYNKVMIVLISIAVIAICSVAAIFLKDKITIDDSAKTSINFYYLETGTSLIKPELREIRNGEKKEVVESILLTLKETPKNETLVPTLPKDVGILDINFDGDIVIIDLSDDYNSMKPGEELFCRASIVWTLTEMDFIQGVKITVNGMELLKTNGEPIGIVTRNDIVIDAEIQPELTNTIVVNLYFSNLDATGLELELRKVEVSANQPVERYVVEQLIAGPEEENHFATVPSETKIRDIKTVDGVCYVDLSSEFVSKHAGGSSGETLTIYSIVNSLTELDYIDKVQFLIEGEKQSEFKGHLDISKPFSKENIYL